MSDAERKIRAWTVPWALVWTRLFLGVFLLALNRYLSDREILWIYLAAFTTDYFDGVIARKIGTATPALRRADSAVDSIFHVCLGTITLLRQPGEFVRNRWMLGAFLATAAAWYALDAIRWKRLAGFHAYSAKLFSLGLMVWVIALYGGVETQRLLSMVLAIGVVSNCEGVAISLLLRVDRSDVAGVWKLVGGRTGWTQPAEAAAISIQKFPP